MLTSAVPTWAVKLSEAGEAESTELPVIWTFMVRTCCVLGRPLIVIATVPEYEPWVRPLGFEAVGPALILKCKSRPLTVVFTEPGWSTWIQGSWLLIWMITVLGSELVAT